MNFDWGLPGTQAHRGKNMAFRWRPRRSLELLGLVGLLIYMAWIGGPYLRSIFVRDAAVTTWISLVSAPIKGFVDTHPLYPGERVGPDGRIALIENPLLDPTTLAKAEADFDRGTERIQSLERLVGLLQNTVAARVALAVDFANAFKQDLDGRIAEAGNKLGFLKQQLALARLQAGRLAKLSAGGHGSPSAADAEAALVADLQRSLSGVQGDFDRTTLRRRIAEQGTLLLEDGTDAAVASRSLDEARLKLAEAQTDLSLARLDLDSAKRVVAAARTAYAAGHLAAITAPAGALVWSLIAAPGAAVEPGAPVASWIDCRIMLVDVPLSDVELALLPRDALADVVLEGEHRVRRGRLVLTRGAAATIGNADLAALAKGRRPGIGQALVSLEPTPADIEACPVGQAAHVDFPEVGLIDILRARLRL
jgi:multidrug resistance efflux pump